MFIFTCTSAGDTCILAAITPVSVLKHLIADEPEDDFKLTCEKTKNNTV